MPREPSDAAASALWSAEPLTTADGSLTLYSPRFQQAFRSERGARSEAQAVFVGNSGVEARLLAGLPTRVLEVGLGTATNFALSAAQAIATGTPLAYAVWEREPLPLLAWQLTNLEALAPTELVRALLAARREWGEMRSGSYRFAHGPVTLEVVVATIEALPPADSLALVDAIYLDPFSPEANPEAWAAPLLQRLAGHLAPGGRLVSYSVRGSVRRALADAGLRVEKLAGPIGGKREVLRATNDGAARAQAPAVGDVG